MNIDSQSKVMRAGFIILRRDDQPQPRIKRLEPRWPRDPAWVTHEKFDTKAARDRRFRELLENPEVIED